MGETTPIGGGTNSKAMGLEESNIKTEVESTIPPNQHVAEIEDTLPEGGYGWVIVGCQIGVNAVTWGRSLLHLLALQSTSTTWTLAELTLQV
jgi:hypothetical protein